MRSDVSPSSLSGAKWLGARAALARKRLGRFATSAALIFSAVGLALFLLPARGVAPEPPRVAIVAAAAVLAVILGFLVNLLAEITRPTIADGREAETVAQCPAFVVTRDVKRTTSRSGVDDTYRMIYLELSATRERSKAIEIRGNDRAVIATVAGRLALAAADDARATLVVDADAEGSPMAAFYNQRPEPGFTDAEAGVRLWREVARPVGISEGLSIDVIPGGSLRRNRPDVATGGAARAEFERFRSEYDFCVTVAASDLAATRLRGILDTPPALLCSVTGRTTHASLAQSAARIRAAGTTLSGVVLWDRQLPGMPRRKELMARTQHDTPRAHPHERMAPL